MRKQCASCPWKLAADPRKIPAGYSVAKHRRLRNTIAEPGALPVPGAVLRIFACHASPIGGELPCVGWLAHQLGEGNNIALRMAVRVGAIDADIQLDGEQHACFDDTLPRPQRKARPT